MKTAEEIADEIVDWHPAEDEVDVSYYAHLRAATTSHIAAERAEVERLRVERDELLTVRAALIRAINCTDGYVEDRCTNEFLCHGATEIELFIKRLTAERDAARRDLAEAARFVECLLNEDPNDMAADAVTVLDVWRKRASAFLARLESTEKTDG